jgi:hypothetical protein
MRRPYKCTDEAAVAILNKFLHRYPKAITAMAGPCRETETNVLFQLLNQFWGVYNKLAPIMFVYDNRERLAGFEIDPEGDTTYLDPDIKGASLLMAKLAHIQPQGWAHIEKKCPAEYKLFMSLSQREFHDTTRFERDEMMACTGRINEALMMRDPKPAKEKKR